jgi:hypothetical protein
VIRMVISSFRLTLFADYFQICVEDEGAKIDVSQQWTPDALRTMIAFDPNSDRRFVFATIRNMDVPVEVEVHEVNPLDNLFERWDAVNACSLNILSGALVVMGITDYYPTAPHIPLAQGSYRVIICYGGLNTLSKDGLDGDDHYQIVLWPAPFSSFQAIKKRFTQDVES